MSTSENNKRIAKNTMMLYVRMLLVMGVTLYTSRVVLNILGVEDFGIYNVVGGTIAMLGFLNASMSISVQRFLSFELGKQSEKPQGYIQYLPDRAYHHRFNRFNSRRNNRIMVYQRISECTPVKSRRGFLGISILYFNLPVHHHPSTI